MERGQYEAWSALFVLLMCCTCIDSQSCYVPPTGKANGVIHGLMRNPTPGLADLYTLTCFPGYEIDGDGVDAAAGYVTHMQLLCDIRVNQALGECVCARETDTAGVNGAVDSTDPLLYACADGFISPSGVAGPDTFSLDCAEPLPDCYCNVPVVANGYVSGYEDVTSVPGFRIACNEGYEVSGTNPATCASATPPTCMDTDECDASPCGNPADFTCSNIPGAYYCVPLTTDTLNCGFPGDELNAHYPEVNIDLARAGATPATIVTCEAGWTTGAGGTTYTMECVGTDWVKSGSCTVDINECTENPGICGANAQCINKPGSFTCDCDDGYYWDATVQRPNTVVLGASYCLESRCVEPGVYPNAWMEPIPLASTKPGQTWMVQCKLGWQVAASVYEFTITCTADAAGILGWNNGGRACNEDRNECVQNPCGDYGTCINNRGSFYCICPDGYAWNEGELHNPLVVGGSPTGECVKVECEDPPVIEYAIRLEGEGEGGAEGGEGWMFLNTLTYTCNPGYRPSHFLYDDVTTRQLQVTCSDESRWETLGHPTCVRISCPTPDVKQNAELKSSHFKYGDVVTYVCEAGYQSSGNAGGTEITATCQADGTWTDSSECVDIDECGLTPAVCGDAKHTCVNRPGIFHCSCASGYRLDSGGQCIQIPLVSITDPQVVGCELIERMGFCRETTCRSSPSGFPFCICPEGDGGPFCAREEERFPMLGTVLGIVAICLIFILFVIVIMMCLVQARPGTTDYGKREVIAAPQPYSPMYGRFRLPWGKARY